MHLELDCAWWTDVLVLSSLALSGPLLALHRIGTPSPDSALEYYYALFRDDTDAGVSFRNCSQPGVTTLMPHLQAHAAKKPHNLRRILCPCAVLCDSWPSRSCGCDCCCEASKRQPGVSRDQNVRCPELGCW